MVFDNLGEPAEPEIYPIAEEDGYRCPRCEYEIDNNLLPVCVIPQVFSPFTNTTFVVEDKTQKIVISNLAEVMGKNVDIVVANGCDKVKMLYEHYKQKNILENSYFLVDGDNKKKYFPYQRNFIQLEKYCIENYFFVPEICAIITEKSVDETKGLILKSIKKYIERKIPVFHAVIDTKGFQINLLSQSILDRLDGSEILEEFLKLTAKKKTLIDFINCYIEQCHEHDQLSRIFPKEVIEIVKSAKDKDF